MLAELKKSKGYASDADLAVEDLRDARRALQGPRSGRSSARTSPTTPMEQLWGGIGAVFSSWNGKRAVSYRRIEGIPDEWGTAVNVQAMVFGNMGDSSATGVAFTRNPATGENKFYGEWLVNAQGEDVVAGHPHPEPAQRSDQERPEPPPAVARDGDGRRPTASSTRSAPGSRSTSPTCRTSSSRSRTDGSGCCSAASGKRTGTAALNMAMDMLAEQLIDEKEAVLRVSPAQLDELLHPIVDPAAEKSAKPLATGLPAGPGGACRAGRLHRRRRGRVGAGRARRS